MSEITERGYKGPITFYKHLKYGYMAATAESPEEFRKHWNPEEYMVLGSIEVEATFEVDTREAEIETLERAKEKVRAELAMKLASIDDRISKLRALPHASGS